MEYYNYMCSQEYNDELYHHGVKGMKWGQHIFGKVKAHKAKKRRIKNLEKARQAKAQKHKEAEDRKRLLDKGLIPVKKMTDDELAYALTRLEAERQYKQKILETSTGRNFMNKMWKEAVTPALTEAGKDLTKKWLIKQGSEILGIDDKKVKSEYDKWKEAADISRFKKNIEEDRRYINGDESEYNRMKKAADLAEFEKKIRSNEQEKANSANKARKEADEAAERSRREAQKQVDEYNERREKEYSEQRSRNASQYHMKFDTKTKEAGEAHLRETLKYLSGPTSSSSSSASSTSLSTYVRNNSNVRSGQAFVEDSLGRVIGTTSYTELD